MQLCNRRVEQSRSFVEVVAGDGLPHRFEGPPGLGAKQRPQCVVAQVRVGVSRWLRRSRSSGGHDASSGGSSAPWQIST